jgi:hypothetical protein
MHPKRFAIIGGIIMLALGVLAFVPSLSQYPAWLPTLQVDTSYGLFLGLFAMNIFNKLALIVLGAAGILAANDPATNLPKSILYSRVVFVAMGVLAILGLIPQTNTLFGYWPLFGNNIWEHAIFAVLGGYFGYVLSSTVPDKSMPRPPSRESLIART